MVGQEDTQSSRNSMKFQSAQVQVICKANLEGTYNQS